MGSSTSNHVQRSRLGVFLCFCAIFVLLAGFFIRFHPLLIFDTDDWSSTYTGRWNPFPIWGYWNPTRVFPEMFIPLLSNLSTMLVYPITQDFLGALAITFGLFAAFAVTMYVFVFYWLVRTLFKQERASAFLVALIFLVLHFLIFRDNPSNNLYMFWSKDVTGFFFYTIPDLLCCILVMLFMGDKNLMYHFWDRDRLVLKGLLVVGLYLALFSNLYPSVILASYVAGLLLVDLFRVIRSNRNSWLGVYARSHSLGFLILGAWCFIQIFEAAGGRAASMGVQHTEPFLTRMDQAFEGLLALSHDLNKFFLILCVLIVIGIIIVCSNGHHASKRDSRFVGQSAFLQNTIACLIALVLSGAYLLLLCAVSDPSYLARPDTFFGLVFFVFVILFTGVSYIVHAYERVVIILPIVAALSLLCCDTADRTYREFNVTNSDPRTVYAVSNDIIEQVQEAVDQGQEEMILEVPLFNNDGNWPLSPVNDPAVITNSLYGNGIVDGRPKITYKITEEKNEELGVPIPE